MTGPSEAEVIWVRAVETFMDAQVVEFPHSIANRSYYAAFYAVSALFALDGVFFNKHSQVEAAVHRELVRNGKWPVTLGKSYSKLLRYRTTGDYEFVENVTLDEAKETINIARDALEAVHNAHPDRFPLKSDNRKQP